MAQCNAICKNGNLCKNKAKTGTPVCGKHGAQDPLPATPPCPHIKTDGEVCMKPCGAGLPFCKLHHTIVVRLQRNRAAREALIDAVEMLWTFNDLTAGRNILIAAHADGRLTDVRYEFYMGIFDDEIAIWREQGPLPVIRPGNDLQALAFDSQNVHTKAVNTQTEANTKILLETQVSSDQVTMTEIKAAWKAKDTVDIVIQDMAGWYWTKTCRHNGDRLYKRMLDGLWARIRDNADLVQRLWEECFESVGMCCDGHLSRLCNVLVGFDEAFKPAVPIGEILQQRIAAIAAEDTDLLLKVEAAWKAMDELNVPHDERDAWIEAL